MRDIHIIPKKRDKTAKQMYKFMDWYCRVNKDSIHKEVMDRSLDRLLHGDQKING